jgi:hypothetical protein
LLEKKNNPLPEIITKEDGTEWAKCQHCQTLVKLHPPGKYTNNQRDGRIHGLEMIIARLIQKSPYETTMLKSAEAKLNQLVRERELEKKNYYFRIPLYRVFDRRTDIEQRLCASCFDSRYNKQYNQ